MIVRWRWLKLKKEKFISCALCRSVTVHVRMDVLFRRENEDGSVSRVPGYFRTLPEIIHGEQHLDVNKIINSLNQQIDAFNRRGSGFTVDGIMYFFVCCSLFRPLQPSSYIPTPPFLRKKTVSLTRETQIICVCCGRCWRLCIHHRPMQIKYSTTNDIYTH